MNYDLMNYDLGEGSTTDGQVNTDPGAVDGMSDTRTLERTEESAEERGRGGWLRWVIVLLVALVLYALSIGPVYRMVGSIYRADVNAFYVPVAWLYWHVPVAKQFYDWYLHLWKLK
ncbi:MAG TPA: hypothetical protein VLT36_03165 [Candidatus Dormibacteraeota bacterium]|nr:hypothetical protein [Candidatus Dormibacteraeota bacterium]